MIQLKTLDPHVHLRGAEYQHDYLGQGLRDAEAVGLAAVIEQPNPTPHLTDLVAIRGRHRQVEEKKTQNRLSVVHQVHIGLTDNLTQVRSALTNLMARKYGL